jgi:hypothetical protein
MSLLVLFRLRTFLVAAGNSFFIILVLSFLFLVLV